MADERTVYGIKLQNYLAPITADELTVIFNGTTYKVPKAVDGSYMCYGTLGLRTNSAVPSDCPFCIESYVGGDNIVYVNDDTYFNHNPFTIKIIEDSVTTTTECFKKAVQSAASPLIVEATLAPYEATTQSPSYLHASTEEIMEAMTTRGGGRERPIRQFIFRIVCYKRFCNNSNGSV